ncbi:MAG: hypothetical protein KGI52_15560, partial [Burkholderiales bacterium]|nr:hypothetical protein [Burkholderiales bacterium]
NERTPIMKHLFATLLALCVSLANAWGIDVGLGYSKANLHDNGVWYQNGFPNEKVIRRAGVLIGAQHDLSPTWRVHVDGVWLGRNTVSAPDQSQPRGKQ